MVEPALYDSSLLLRWAYTVHVFFGLFASGHAQDSIPNDQPGLPSQKARLPMPLGNAGCHLTTRCYEPASKQRAPPHQASPLTLLHIARHVAVDDCPDDKWSIQPLQLAQYVAFRHL